MIDYHYHLSGRNLAEDKEILLKNIEKYELRKVITLAAYFPSRGSGLSNYRLLKHVEDIPEAYMLASLDFNQYTYLYLNELYELEKEKKVLGLKIYTGYQEIDFKSCLFFEALNIFSEKMVMFHGGFCHREKKAFNPIELEDTIKAFKDTKIVISHMGNPFYKEMVYLLNTYDNVFTDVSGLMDKEDDIPRALECIDYVFNHADNRKILFGTDFPIQTYDDTFFLLKDKKITENRLGILDI